MRALTGAVLAIVAARGSLTAQGTWDALLTVDPFPSPYMSDWEINPAIGDLIVTNLGTTDGFITLHYTLARGGKILMSGVSDVQLVPASQSIVFNSESTIGGEADWDRTFEDLLIRTGRLPEGEYDGCVTVTDANGFVLVERTCARFSALYPDPPLLAFPFDGDTVNVPDPIFEWLPIQTPPTGDFQFAYVLQIAEVKEDQAPEFALDANLLHHIEPDLTLNTYHYALGALPFTPGRRYAWRVQALDVHGLSVAANGGRSEVWTFVYREPTVEVERPVARIELTPDVDTLRFVGDTVHYVARAYDADNIEITGRQFMWRSGDTTVARVDSLGIVTGVSVGETSIIASADAVTDSVLSVTTAASGMVASFEVYDPESATPSLLELIQSGSYDDVVPQLMARLQSGEFRIPIPSLPGMAATNGAQGDLPEQQFDGDGGSISSSYPRARAKSDQAEACSDHTFDVTDPYRDPIKKVFVFYVPLNKQQRQGITSCLGAPDDSTGEVEEAERLRGAIFVVSWNELGLPRAFLAIKGTGLGLPLFGTEVNARFLVINLVRSMSLDRDVLPDNFDGFFGDVSFDAGVGATYYAERRCTNEDTFLCQILAWINPENPVITTQAFAGITASETSVGTGGVGTSLALGFSIAATLPVRTYDIDFGGMSLDSTQVGLLFAVQDSMVVDSLQQGGDHDVDHGLSIGISPTVTTWVTGRAGNTWQLDGAIGLEWDPGADREAVKPKLVISAEVPAVWTLKWFRIGNPMLVFTTPLGSRLAAQDTELALSGAWGIASDEGFGLADDETQTFEEMGRASATFTWKRLRSAREAVADATTAEADAHAAVDSAHADVLRAERARDDAEDELTARRTALDAAPDDSTANANFDQAKSAFDAADKLHKDAQAKYGDALTAWGNASDDLERAKTHADTVSDPDEDRADSSKCWQVMRGRCVTWSVRGSMGNGAIADLMGTLLRLPGLIRQ